MPQAVVGVVRSPKPDNWVEDYLYLEEVYNTKAYLHAYNSFTDWLVSYAIERASSKATLWHRLKAGRYYEAYCQRSIEAGIVPIGIKYLNVSPDSINMIDRIAGDDYKVGDALIDKLVNKEITPKELRLMWSNVKLQRERNNEKAGRSNSYDKNPIKYYDATEEMLILNALSDGGWLSNIKEKGRNGKFRLLSIFRTSPNEAPLDALGVVTSKNGVTLHGIDILLEKDFNVDSSSRLNNLKDAVDYYWLVVKRDSIGEAVLTINNPCGLLLYNSEENVIEVISDADKLDVNLESLARRHVLEEIIKSTI